MKAILYTQFGSPDVLQLREVEKPVPKEKQVLIKVRAASINALDWRPFTMSPIFARLARGGFFTPKDQQIGVDVAGEIEAVGSAVTQFKPGDAVFGVTSGAFAEYACAGQSKVALKPANISFEAAASVPVAGFTALQGLRDTGHIQTGQKVLISGASGGVGTLAVQIAKAYGAEVTAVCSTRNVHMAHSIGADHVIDYKREDFTKNGQQYDLIFAVNGHHSMGDYRRALKPSGICVVAGGSLSQVLQSMLFGRLMSRSGDKRVAFMGISTTPQTDLMILKEFLETGKIVPVVSKSYPLQAAAEAISFVAKEHAPGKVVITVP